MRKSTANLMGVTALIGWSMNTAVTRRITEAQVFGMPALSFTAAGAVLIVFDLIRGAGNPRRAGAGPRFWILGGGAFVAYELLYALALARADSREAALPLGLVNYLWPTAILLLLPLFSPRRFRWPHFLIGLALSLAGAASALLWNLDRSAMWGILGKNRLAFAMMLLAAFLWGFYSHAARRWGGGANGVGWFQLTAGLAFFLLWLESGAKLGLTGELLLPLLLHALLVNALSYLLWDWGVRRGDLDQLGILANFLPPASTLFGVWYLDGGATPGLWLGCLLVTAGAFFCRRGIAEGKRPDS
ncbi:MAG: EamA family transporter [Planctomycetota bacterium]|jgi:drug/metabolite transporter (DMT)-like permease|nr:EamA family transporter [Planctomycetota bacterium]